MDGALFCECMAKLYTNGKWERQAVKCIYLGYDPRSPGYLVRVIGGKSSGTEERTAQVVSFNVTSYPYTNPLVPRPQPLRNAEYDSDSEEELSDDVSGDEEKKEMLYDEKKKDKWQDYSDEDQDVANVDRPEMLGAGCLRITKLMVNKPG
jgi:hypothetical protein